MRRPPEPATDDELEPRGAVERRASRQGRRPAPATRHEVLKQQENLANRVGAYLRDRGGNPKVGLAAGALLIAAATGALAYDASLPDAPTTVELAQAQPLAQEVREGLPSTPGRYPVDTDSVTRDAQGVYRFSWQDPAAGGATKDAAASLVKLAPGEKDELEIGADLLPILFLRSTTPIGVVAQPAPAAGSGTTSTTTTRSGSGGGFVYVGSWYPYEGSYSRTPVYRNPPSSVSTAGSRIGGSVESAAPPPPAARTVSVPGRAAAVSGQARGTGAGTAATGKSGVTSSSGSAATNKASTSGGKSSISTSSSGGFSSGSGSSSSASS